MRGVLKDDNPTDNNIIFNDWHCIAGDIQVFVKSVIPNKNDLIESRKSVHSFC